MIAILLPAAGIDAGGLQMAVGKGADPHLRPRGQDGQTAERYDPKKPMLPGVSTLSPQSGREEIIGLFRRTVVIHFDLNQLAGLGPLIGFVKLIGHVVHQTRPHEVAV